ncbi:MAG: serine dehydratase beta chain [Phycisphaerales bacterium]
MPIEFTVRGIRAAVYPTTRPAPNPPTISHPYVPRHSRGRKRRLFRPFPPADPTDGIHLRFRHLQDRRRPKLQPHHGPLRTAQRFTRHLHDSGVLNDTLRVRTDLYGSLAKTGKGHGTDLAVILGLAGEDPVTCKVEGLHERVEAIKSSGRMHLRGEHETEFDPDADLLFHMDESLPFHPNGVRFTALLGGGGGGRKVSETYYSIGGGFVVQEGETASGAQAVKLPCPCETGGDVLKHCREQRINIPQMVLNNERAWRSDDQIRAGLLQIWRTMQECVYRGCHTGGVLPGGLNVVRRGQIMHDKLMAGRIVAGNSGDAVTDWMNALRTTRADFRQTLKWVSTFALAVNEENAAFGRVVTAPTNGAAGVVPAVMMYAAAFCDLSQYCGVLASSEPEALAREADEALRVGRSPSSKSEEALAKPRASLANASGSDKTGNASDSALLDFMLTAGEVGSLFKKAPPSPPPWAAARPRSASAAPWPRPASRRFSAARPPSA